MDNASICMCVCWDGVVGGGSIWGDITASQSVNYELVYKLLIESRRS